MTLDPDDEPAIDITFLGGNCPVQAEGTIDGKPFYFRARGSHWTLSIGGVDPVDKPDWFWHESYGNGPFDAGWMPVDEAEAFLRAAAGRFHRGEGGMLDV